MDMKAYPVATAAPTLCVSLHDVAPATWPMCERLLETVSAVADIPLTLLVVPDYHHLSVADASGFRKFLDARLERGDELALHGYSHLDEGPPATAIAERCRRRLLTMSEGEFAALDAVEACNRIEKGLDWFAVRGWQSHGFVAPAWLLSTGSWTALRKFPFIYTTSLRNFYLLPQIQVLLSPTLVYSARNAAGRWLSRHWNDMLMHEIVRLPLVRFSLHPNDAQYPAQLCHFQRMLTRLLETHTPLTKTDFAKRW
jgi:predicted deacetylase